jgi:hypothetical protein
LKLVKGLPPLTCREISSVFNARDFLVYKKRICFDAKFNG